MDENQRKKKKTKEYELPNKPIVPAIYPNEHGESNYPVASTENVEFSKEWVDHNIK